MRTAFFIFIITLFLGLVSPPASAQTQGSGNAINNLTPDRFLDRFTAENFCRSPALREKLFNSSTSSCTYDRDTNPMGAVDCLIPNLVSSFESLIGQVFGTLYCGFQQEFIPILGAVMSLFIVTFGAMFLIGIVELSAGEAVTRLLKLALVWTFATSAQFGIGVAYNLLTAIPKEGMELALNTLVSDESLRSMSEDERAGAALQKPLKIILPLPRALDMKGEEINRASLSKEGSGDIMKILLILSLFMMFIPPVFAMVMGFIIQVIVTFVRTFTAYLLSVAGIAFLLTLSPLFLSFALFKTTYSYFEKWLRYLASFAIQIIIIFSFLALLQLLNPVDFFRKLINVSYPYTVEFGFSYKVDINNMKDLSYPLKATDIVLWSVCRDYMVPDDNIVIFNQDSILIQCQQSWQYNPFCGNFETPASKPDIDGAKELTYGMIGLDGKDGDNVSLEEYAALVSLGIVTQKTTDDERKEELKKVTDSFKNTPIRVRKSNNINPLTGVVDYTIPRIYEWGMPTGDVACWVKKNANDQWDPIAQCTQNKPPAVNGDCEDGAKPVYNVIPIFDLIQDAKFLKFFIITLVGFFMLLYVMEAALRNMPDLAKRLSGLDDSSSVAVGNVTPISSEQLARGAGTGAMGSMAGSGMSLKNINAGSITKATGSAWHTPPPIK